MPNKTQKKIKKNTRITKIGFIEDYRFIVLFLLFLILRIFVENPYYFVAGDEARYLGLAQNFPYHTLYGDQTLFLQHGPIFPYTIHLMNLITQNDLLAGLLVSLVSAIITFFLLIKFWRLIGKDDRWICWFMLFFTLSETFVKLATIIYYESLYFLIFISVLTSLIAYLKSQKNNKIKYKNFYLLLLSSLLGFIFAFSTDKVIFLIPIMLLMIIFYSSNRKNIVQYIPVAVTCIGYALVLIIRLSSFLHHDYIPIGVDGLVEDVRQFGIGQLISPFSFSEGQKFATFRISIDPIQMAAAFGYSINIVPFNIPTVLDRSDFTQLINLRNILLVIIIYIPIMLFILYGFIKNLKRNHFITLFAIITSFVFLTGLASNRHLIFFLIPLFYFFAEGVTAFIDNKFQKNNSQYSLKHQNNINYKNNTKKFDIFGNSNKEKILLIAISVLLVTLFLIPKHSFSLTREKVVQGYSVAEYINSIQEEKVFVQTGYSIEQAYLLNKKVYGLVADTNKMLKYIDYFGIDYIVIGSKKWTHIDEPSINYIKSHPEKFKLIKTINETYPFPETPDTFYIFSVENNN
ncbi:MAG: hypothetical protein QXG00_01275 [Candidatus Woesearchaeota archaeon]